MFKGLLLFVLTASVSGFAAPPPLARVGTATITIEDFTDKYNQLKRQSLAPLAPEEFLNELIRFEMAAQEGEKQGLSKDPEVRDRIKHVLFTALLDKHLGQTFENMQVNETEMKSYYKRHPELRLSHIVVGRDKPPARAQQILSEARKANKSFEDLARETSDDLNSKDMGGDIGIQSKSTLNPHVYEAAQKLKIGEVSGLIETPLGFQIIKLIERRSYDAANKQVLRQLVLEEKRQREMDRFFDKLGKQYKVEIAKDQLKALRK